MDQEQAGATAVAGAGLPRVPGVLRRHAARQPHVVTWTLLVLCVGIELTVGVLRISADDAGRGALGLVGAVGTAGPLLVRRTRPVLAFTLSAAALLATLPYAAFLPFATAATLYAVAVHRSTRAGWVGFGTIAAAVLMLESVGLGHRQPIYAVGEVVTLLVAALLGTGVGRRHRYQTQLVHRTAELAWERDQQARLARAAERSRIAREMHDIVSHSLTVVVTLSDGAGATTVSAPGSAQLAMQQVGVTARQALADMRRTLGVLRSEDLPRLGPGQRAAVVDPGLPRPPGAVRRFSRQHPRLVDLALILLVAYSGVLDGVQVVLAGQTGRGALEVAGTVLAAAPLLLRRSRPLLAYAFSLLALAATLSSTEIVPLPTAAALYAVTVYRSGAVGWLALAGGTLLLALAEHSPLGHPVDTNGYLAFEALTLLVGLLAGLGAGQRRRYESQLVQRAAQLARERDQQARLAQVAERTRIAREMHDIVSHSLTVVVTLADGAAAAAGSAPGQAQRAMQQVGVTARQALADLRRTLGVLRSDEAAAGRADPRSQPEPQPTVADLPALVAAVSRSAVPVHLSIIGTPPPDAGLQLAVYRIVQEALTNAVRYAPDAASVSVLVECTRTATTVTVDDDGSGAAQFSWSGARGLVGIRERAALYGGQLEVGPRTPRGWRVRTRLWTGSDADASTWEGS